MVEILDIVVVNWNSKKLLEKCIQSIDTHQQENKYINKVVIIDNDSTDGSIGFLDQTEKYAKNIKIILICNEKNLGFAKACNQGAQECNSKYLLFLNPDTLIQDSSVKIPINYLESLSKKNDAMKIGICGVQLLDDNGNVTPSCSRFPNLSRITYSILGLHKMMPNIFKPELMTDWNHKEMRVVDQIKGAYFLIRSELFNELNGFDERYFVYYEEVDLSLRAKQHGWLSVYISDAAVYHKGAGTTESVKGIALFYLLRSRLLYFCKNFYFGTSLIHAILTLTIECPSRIVQSLLKKDFQGSIYIIKAYLLLYCWLIQQMVIIPR